MTGRILTTLASDGCLEVTIDRTEAGNALTAAMTDELRVLFHTPPEAARFVLLQGAGQDFCAGRDSPMPPNDGAVTARTIRTRVADPVLDFYESLRELPLPVIAVVKGRALGVGLALAGLADIVLADTTARFALPEMGRDIPPLLVGTAMADRLSRAALAKLIFGREEVSAEEAVAMGLAAEACQQDMLDERVAHYRAKLSQNSLTTLTTVKRFLNAAPGLNFAMRREYAAAEISAATSERYIKTEKEKPR